MAVPKDSPQSTETKHQPQDWMKNSAEKINGMKLCALPLPGSHDAGSYGAIRTRSRTQEKPVMEQLNAGVRFFDFRVIVDGQVYFSHHGLDHSRDNPYVDANTSRTLLAQIKTFCENHDGEIVILCFNDFWRFQGKGLVDGYASEQEKKALISHIAKLFGPLLIPKALTIPTYKTCIDAKQRILVIFDDGCQDPMIWNKKDCLDDHFSAYNSSTNRTWKELSELTIKDQQTHLTPAKRNLERFCVTQAVLNYKNERGTTTDNEKKIENSRNYAGAERMNPMFDAAYQQWWDGKSAVAKKPESVRRPNILLMDFVGEFDSFSATCESLIKRL
jgi:hypothetical protein